MSFPRFIPSCAIQDYPVAKPAKAAKVEAHQCPKTATLATLAAIPSVNPKPGTGEAEAERVARLDAERNAHDKATGRGYDYTEADDPAFTCAFCFNDPARCGWCGDHAGNPSIISCGDCTAGRMKPAPRSWRRDVVPDSHSPLIPDSIRAKIEEIEAEARVAGWTHERLWNTGFWDQPRGLAAVLGEDDQLVEVTADYIAILKTQKKILRFRRRTS
jgi:hypothetical protein